MAVFERFIVILIGIALIAAAFLGAALYYHFSRFSPDRNVTVATMSVYAAGVAMIAFFVLLLMILR